MANEKSLRAAAVELSEVLNLDPVINAKAKLSILTKEVEEAIGLINPAEGDTPDSFSEDTLEVILEFNPDAFPAPKKAKKPAKPVVEEVEEEEEEEEEKAPVKPVRKAAKPADEEEEEEEVKPAGKKAAFGGKKAPAFKGAKETLGTSRMEQCALAMANLAKPKTMDEVAAAADKAFVAKKGTSNVKQAKNIIKVILPAAEAWGICTFNKETGKLSQA